MDDVKFKVLTTAYHIRRDSALRPSLSDTTKDLYVDYREEKLKVAKQKKNARDAFKLVRAAISLHRNRIKEIKSRASTDIPLSEKRELLEEAFRLEKEIEELVNG